jgi:hypothetical protein
MLNTVAVHHDVYSMMMHLQVFKVFPRDQGCGELHGCFLAGRTKLTTDFKFRGREWQITVGRWRKKTMVGNKYSDGQTIMLILIHASDGLVFVSRIVRSVLRPLFFMAPTRK